MQNNTNTLKILKCKNLIFLDLVIIIYQRTLFCARFAPRKKLWQDFKKVFISFLFKMFQNLSLLLGIDITILKICLGFFYFLPIIIQLFYKWFSRGLFRATLFLGWTPLPRMILTLNIIESNKGNDEINEWIDQILENQEKIIKKLNFNFIINKKNN